ncbi:flagellar filament capping protein FliD [Porcipelethomonas sp.]|uniref:flagellar filament capping protein FliD n=1 Tax=Porcipelethomonas sp. TaxID=2981675 RepID=UPI003EF21435
MNVSSSSTSTYTNAAYSSNGVSGMVSGLDTESLVESMLSNIQTKIDKQNQEKQRLEWKQEIYRDVIKEINSFQSKYFNLTSSSCIRLESFYNTMKTTSSSSAVSVTSGSNAVDGDFQMQVARLATKSTVTSSKVGTGDISTVSSKADSFEYSRTVNIKIGDGNEVSVDLKDVTDDEICSRINNAVGSEFAKAVKETVTTYSDADGNALTFNADENKYYSADGSEYTGAVTTESKEVLKEITFSSSESFEISGTSAGLGILGFNGTAKSSAAKDDDGNEIDGSFELKSTAANSNFSKVGNVNGSVDITLDGVTKSFEIKENESMADLQKKVQSAFGSTVKFTNDGNGWNISVEGTGRQLKVSAGADTMEAIGFGKDTTVVSNQLVRTDSIGKLGIGDASDTYTKYSFSINGVEIEYTAADSVSTIMNKINTSDAGVNLTYDELSDKFKFTSASTGTGYDINLTGDDEGLFSKLGFSIDASGSLDQSTVTAGQNAVVNINGVTVERANNDFTYNGLTISLKSTTGNYELNADGSFAENSDGTIKSAAGSTESKVEVSTSRDVDKIVDNLKSFVEDYNKLIEKLNGYTHEKASYKSYAPLTDAQKKEMTEKEIELWEEKAKEGLLRNDNDISDFLSSMRSAMYTNSGSKYVLSNIGINSSSEWSDYGKLSIDEDKLKSMLQTDPNGVKDLFVGDNGLATRLNKICDKTASTSSGSPGTLVTIAGVEGKGSENSNTIKNQLDSIANKLTSLKKIYETRKERYWNQFNAMESALSKLNSQSDYFSSMM